MPPDATPIEDQRADVLRAARDVLGTDPRAGMSVIGRAAGVGMSQLYRLFASKQDLLRALADSTERIYAHRLQEAHARLDAGEEPFVVYAAYLTALVDDGALALGTATPGMDEAGFRAAKRWEDLAEINRSLYDRVQASGQLREGVAYLDAAVILTAVSAVRGEDPERSHQLRRRVVSILIEGLRAGLPPVESAPPAPTDLYRSPD